MLLVMLGVVVFSEQFLVAFKLFEDVAFLDHHSEIIHEGHWAD